MNTLKLIALSILCFTFFSCGDDNEETGIIGTWSAESLTSETSTRFELLGTIIESDVINVGSNLNYTITFTEDTYTAMGEYDVTTNINTFGAPPIEQITSIESATVTGSYTIDGNMITATESFFDFEVDGVMETDFAEEQTATFRIENDRLIFSQSESFDTIGVTGTAMSESVWVRQ